MKKIIAAIIPARSGSKAIKNKNIIIFNKNKYSFNFDSKKCRINKIILSTDSIKYREIGKNLSRSTIPKTKKILKRYYQMQNI